MKPNWTWTRMTGRKKCGEMEKKLEIWRITHHLSNMVQVMSWHGHVWLPVQPVHSCLLFLLLFHHIWIIITHLLLVERLRSCLGIIIFLFLWSIFFVVAVKLVITYISKSAMETQFFSLNYINYIICILHTYNLTFCFLEGLGQIRW